MVVHPRKDYYCTIFGTIYSFASVECGGTLRGHVGKWVPVASENFKVLLAALRVGRRPQCCL